MTVSPNPTHAFVLSDDRKTNRNGLLFSSYPRAMAFARMQGRPDIKPYEVPLLGHTDLVDLEEAFGLFRKDDPCTVNTVYSDESTAHSAMDGGDFLMRMYWDPFCLYTEQGFKHYHVDLSSAMQRRARLTFGDCPCNGRLARRPGLEGAILRSPHTLHCLARTAEEALSLSEQFALGGELSKLRSADEETRQEVRSKVEVLISAAEPKSFTTTVLDDLWHVVWDEERRVYVRAYSRNGDEEIEVLLDIVTAHA
jgi:hypothetical protein